MKYIILTFISFFLANILVWYQLNSQLVWKWAEGYKSMWVMSLLGIPISLLFWFATKWGYVGFGSLWSIRFIGFAVSMMTFPFMTYFYLGEVMTFKTIITLVLSIIIILIQLT